MPFVLDIVNMKVGRSGRLFCCRVVLNVSLIAGGASAAAFEVCRRFRRSRAHCLAERGSRASRAEMTTRRRMVMRHGVRARRFPRKTQAGASVGKAARASSVRSRKKGSGDPAVDTYCLRPVRNTGCLCGNIRCRPCRRKGTRHAQSRQHNSATERFLKGELSNHKGIFDELHIRHPFCSDRKFTLFFQSGRLEKI